MRAFSKTITIILILTLNTFAQRISEIDIPYQKFVLNNGLTLIVHEDHKAPIVAVNVWYHVGSKNEKPGKTGFAHLFEHLMFNGSENYNDDYFKVLDKAGATDMNGTTNNDRTNYFQNVPKSALDLVLWMESDRMGHLKGAINQARLDEQRGVVENEKRQDENEPYAIRWELIPPNTFPKGHPYSWSTIGSMEDLDSAKLKDVHEWFSTYYGPNNAVLVIAGDVTPEEAKAKVEKYFGDIPPGPPVARHNVWIAKMSGTHRMNAEDRVPQTKITMIWNVPEWGNKETVLLNLISDILASGKNSRLYKRLVYDDQIATEVSSFIDRNEIAGQFYIEATVKPGGDAELVEKAIKEELSKLLQGGIDPKEFNRIRTQYISGFIRGIERIGGFGGKSDILAESFVFTGDPGYYKKTLKMVEDASVKDLQETANKWLSDGVFILTINPYPTLKAAAVGADRKKLPETGTPPDAVFPRIEKAVLSNGMKVMLVRSTSVPLVNFKLMIDAGYASDQMSSPGTASMAMKMMEEGTKNRSSLQIDAEKQSLGASIYTQSWLDNSEVDLSALKENLDRSIELWADMIMNPSFPERELERLKKERCAEIEREKADPFQMGWRVFPLLLYGKNHAYGIPFTGTGYIETVNKLSREDIVKFYNTWVKPNNATLVAAGDITLPELIEKLEKQFRNWQKGDVPKKNLQTVSLSGKKIVYLIDKPQAQQSSILAGQVAPPVSDGDNIDIESLNNVLGGSFTSRINMNLREDKHWSYGAWSFIPWAKAQRPFIVSAAVQYDKTKESMQEISKELQGIIKDNPPSDAELNKTRDQQVLALAGEWETIDAIQSAMSKLVMYDLPDDYYQTYIQKVKGLKKDNLFNAAKKLVHPENLLWVVVGDRSKIEEPIKQLGYEVQIIDSDGNMIDDGKNVNK